VPARIVPDEDEPSAAIEIPLAKPLPDYNLVQVDQPTPRDVDALLMSQGFCALIDDARGVLMDLLAHPPARRNAHPTLDLTHAGPPVLQLIQLTGAICPGDDEVYRPGLWIVLRDPKARPRTRLTAATEQLVTAIADEFISRMQLD